MSSQHRQTSARSVLLHERARVMRARPTLSEARLGLGFLAVSSGSRFGRQIVDFLATACITLERSALMLTMQHAKAQRVVPPRTRERLGNADRPEVSESQTSPRELPRS